MSHATPAERRPDLWLVRHGETEWSASGRHTGRTDIPLTDEGIRQARALGRHLAGRSFALVLTSPLSRAADTCGLAGYGDVAQPSEDLLEWDYGQAEGRTTTEMRAQHPGWSVWTSGPPGGETVEEVGRRTERVIARALEASGAVALFAHAHVLRILAARWLRLPPGDGRLFALGPASLSVLGWEREARVISRWNDRSFVG
ncbi:MAG TPA: histidine phosphatase family protein [Verrucomicrobiae bacterium]|jgi:broad specificity phosphatase PhoE|nr:histidine phosphatase family protein [Methylomirabilota bacterium]HWN93079.1 histidine phosphatase family protein [Verrucomicrobiae bacterium]